jgi:hypothetical protein
MESPYEVAGWICAESGDQLWNAISDQPLWIHRYAPVVQTANLALYRLKEEGEGRIH